MFFHKFIFINIILIKFVHTDIVICENNECRRAGLIETDVLFKELDVIKKGHEIIQKRLQEFDESYIRNMYALRLGIRSLSYMLEAQANEQKRDVVDSSLYDNLWIVMQSRQDGSVDFYRNWTEYKQGFGNEAGEFFIGLDKIYELTNDRDHELLVILTDFEGTPKFAHYDHFLIGNERERYRLKKLGKYSGTAGNQLKFHTNMFFSTRDRDNDDADEGNCAHWFKGAWWYYNCMTSNLNGPYRYNGTLNEDERGVGVTWGSYDQIKFSYKTTQMLLRVKN